MGKRYYRRRYTNRDKYSVEQTLIKTPPFNAWTTIEGTDYTATSQQWSIPIVPPVDFQGMRKIKHLTLSFCNSASASESEQVSYVVVYVPQGVNPNTIQYPGPGSAVNMYEPNQFVMSQGVLDFSAGPCRIRSPLSRNLNSGDRIILVLASLSATTATLMVSCRYAITLQ